MSNLGKEKLFLPTPCPNSISFSSSWPLWQQLRAKQPALSFQLSQNYMKKLYLYYIKTVSGGLVGVGLKVGLLCSSGQGWVFFFHH